MEEDEGCPSRTSLDVRRRETRDQMRVHMRKPWSDFPHTLKNILIPYIRQGFAYAADTECKKAVQVELEMMKSICNHVDSELDKLKLDYKEAGLICFRARKELHTMDGIEGLLNSDDIYVPPDTCGWLVEFQKNPDDVKAFLDIVECELKCQHQMEESQLKDQTKVEENKSEDPEDMKKRVRILIEQIDTTFRLTSDIDVIIDSMFFFRGYSLFYYIRLKRRLVGLSNHVCQDNEHKQEDKESEQSTLPQKKRRLLQPTDKEARPEEEVPFFAMGRMRTMLI